MKNNLYWGKGLLCPEGLLIITIKKEKQARLAVSLPFGCGVKKADSINISEKSKKCLSLVPFAKPTMALLPATLHYKQN